jgi:hypothetical protein
MCREMASQLVENTKKVLGVSERHANFNSSTAT